MDTVEEYTPTVEEHAPVENLSQKYAEKCLIFGLMSLFVLPTVFSIVGIVYYNKYKKNGNGEHNTNATVGLACSIVSIILQIFATIACVCFVLFLVEIGRSLSNLDPHDVIDPFMNLLRALYTIG